MKGYEKLDDVLARAFKQASEGKGKERHANDLPFHEQPMQQVANQVGRGFLLGQAIKKLVESQGLPPEQAVAEQLGAICYIAGSIIHLEAANDNAPMQSVSYSNDPQPEAHFEPIMKRETREYLDHNFQLVEVEVGVPFPTKWISVPEGAESLYKFIDGIEFQKDGHKYYYGPTGKWVERLAEIDMEFVKILWQRPYTRDQAREILSKMVRGEKKVINDIKVTFDKDGYFHARLKGYLAEKTKSVSAIVKYLFEGN